MLLERPSTYVRRKTRTVWVGQVAIGGNYPIRVQSMTTSDTKDTASLIPEIEGLVDTGCEIVRVTVPTQADCDNLPNIRAELKKRRIKVPLVADIHFTPTIAMQVVPFVEKVRINPGNFVDKKLFKTFEYTDQQYAEELTRIREKFVPLVLKCKEADIALRIGANHGSLSDRIMNRYGDTPEGMVESALEFVRICEELDYRNLVLSMKASNVQVMTAAYRLLDERMKEEGMSYPFHLGVTEAGFGDEGRIKSAIGIGALLEDGIGDTIRVSLTEDSIHEVPVAYQLVRKYNALHSSSLDQGQGTSDQGLKALGQGSRVTGHGSLVSLPLQYRRRPTRRIMVGSVPHGGDEPVRVWVSVPLGAVGRFAEEHEAYRQSKEGKIFPLEGLEIIDDGSGDTVPSFSDIPVILQTENPLVSVDSPDIHVIRRLAATLETENSTAPLLLRYCPGEQDNPLLSASTFFGSLLLDGLGDAICLPLKSSLSDTMKLAYNILQGTRLRVSKTEYIACPSCGRTQFDLQSTTRRIQEITSHLKGVKIAVMGCIVNGPGEMADADFGYVGTGSKKISLYVGKECIERNIPEEEAVSRLVALIKAHNRWVDVPRS